jgi:hypothetical protein
MAVKRQTRLAGKGRTIRVKKPREASRHITKKGVSPKVGKKHFYPKGLNTYIYTTGPFVLSQEIRMVTFGIYARDEYPQEAKISIFQYAPPNGKTCLKEFTYKLGWWHGIYDLPWGVLVEIQIECNSRQIFPFLRAWEDENWQVAGLTLKSSDFLRIMP